MTCTRGRNRRAAFFAAVTTVRQEGHSFLCFSGLRGANVRLKSHFYGPRMAAGPEWPHPSRATLRPPVARKHKRSRRPHHPHPAPRGTRPRWRGRTDAPVPAAARAVVQLLAMTIAGSCEAPPSWWRCHRAGRRLSLRSVGFCPERQSKSGCEDLSPEASGFVTVQYVYGCLHTY